MLRNDFTFTKRQLGLLMVVIGILGIGGLLAIDLLSPGREGGIGPAQRLALGLMGMTVLLGLSLIPLGNQPV